MTGSDTSGIQNADFHATFHREGVATEVTLDRQCGERGIAPHRFTIP